MKNNSNNTTPASSSKFASVKKFFVNDKADKNSVNWKCIITLFAIAVVIGIIVSIVNVAVAPNKDYATCNVNLAWDGASEGLTPSGEGFDLLRVERGTIIADAIAASGFTVDAAAVDANLVVTASYPKAVLESLLEVSSVLDGGVSELSTQEYHPTDYTFTLYCNLGLSKNDTKKLLTNITDSYKTYIASLNAFDMDDIDAFTAFDVTSMDYLDALEVLQYKADTVGDIAKRYQTYSPNFVYNGQGFASLVTGAEKLSQNEIDSAKSKCRGTNLTKDKADLLQRYQYIVRNHNLDLAEVETNLAEVKSLIDMYQRDSSMYVSTSNGGSMVEGNSNKTYSTLVARQASYSESKAYIESQITYYEKLIKDLEDSGSSSAAYKAAATEMDKEIVAISEKVKSLESVLKEFVTAYNEQKAGEETISVSGLRASKPFLSGSFIIALVKGCGPFCMIVLIIALFMELKRQIAIDKAKEN